MLVQFLRETPLIRTVRAITLKVLAQVGGMPPQSVNPKNEIDDGSGERNEPNKTDPGDRGT